MRLPETGGGQGAVPYTPAKEEHMSQSHKALNVGLSGIVGLALDADLSRSVIADELRRVAEILCPSHGVRFPISEERMSIDPDDQRIDIPGGAG